MFHNFCHRHVLGWNGGVKISEMYLKVSEDPRTLQARHGTCQFNALQASHYHDQLTIQPFRRNDMSNSYGARVRVGCVGDGDK